MCMRAHLYPTLCDPVTCRCSLSPRNLLGKNTEQAISSSRTFSTQGLEPTSLVCLLHWQVDLFTAESPGKPQNILIEIIWTLLRWPQLKHLFIWVDNFSLSQSVACIVEWFPSSASFTKMPMWHKNISPLSTCPWGSIMLLHEIALPGILIFQMSKKIQKKKVSYSRSSRSFPLALKSWTRKFSNFTAIASISKCTNY